MLVGLTGGIGSGKSSTAGILAGLGAVVIDADGIAREVMAPGGPAYADVVARFGPRVLDGSRAIDRAALADLVFADAGARADLEAIVHPHVWAEIDRRAAPPLAAGSVVVAEVPLLVESGWRPDLVVVVDCPEDVALARLVGRGMDEADARARMAAQATREGRQARADIVIVNDGTITDLRAHVVALWPRLLASRLA